MKKCLIVVDYQNDFVSGALGFPKAASIERRIAEKIKLYRDAGGVILFTYDTHGKDYPDTQEGRNLPIPHCVEGTEGHELFGAVREQHCGGDLNFYKRGFGSDQLYEHLKSNPYKSIELCGVVTNICVISNAVLAKTAQPETEIIVDSSCVASNAPELNKAALDVMRSLQIKIK